MWFAAFVQSFALEAMASQVGAEATSPAGQAPRPIATRQTCFAIPFRIERPADASRQPVEVQLWISPDRGANWQLHSKVLPQQQRFLFRTESDGDYWFLIRTLDRAGVLRPERTNGRVLRVVVDTTPPKLQLRAQRGEAGQISAQWQIDDPNLKPESLTIQFRIAADQPWQPVAVSRNRVQSSGSSHTGEVTWWPQAKSGEIQIRAEVSDAAGNPAVSHAQVRLERVTGATPPPAAEDPARQWRPGTPDPAATPWAAQDSQSAARYPDGGQPAGSLAAEVSPPIGNQYAPASAQDERLRQAGLPPGERPRMVKSRLIELEYDVDSIGPSGIDRVELWGTRDGGRSWRSFALDDDNRSPLLVTVQEEGIYGFRVVGQSGAGLGGKPPQSGQLPEIFIGVDMTDPEARIISTEQGTGVDAGKLIISYETTDALLAARPVSLSFSESPGGPWTTIAAGLENTGRYAWPLDGRLPQQIYLRLEVRDEAGNVGVHETNQAVSFDRLSPSVRIRSVRPLEDSAILPHKQYNFR